MPCCNNSAISCIVWYLVFVCYWSSLVCSSVAANLLRPCAIYPLCVIGCSRRTSCRLCLHITHKFYNPYDFSGSDHIVYLLMKQVCDDLCCLRLRNTRTIYIPYGFSCSCRTVLPVIKKMTLWVLMESLNERLEVIVQDSALLRFDCTE